MTAFNPAAGRFQPGLHSHFLTHFTVVQFMNSKISGIALAQRQVPHCAVVFYSTETKPDDTQFGTFHEIRSNGEKFELASGTSLTVENLKNIASMASEGLRHKAEILSENVLVATDDLLVWWMPAGRQHMYFDVSMGGHAEVRQRLQGVNGKMPHPALVFALRRTRQSNHAYTGISVYALAENMRPSATTNIFRAPLLNVDGSGSVCWGNGTKPKGTAVADIPAWQSLFFTSVFTHYNGSSPVRGSDCYGFIADLLEEGVWEFPIDRLLPYKGTLQDVVDGFTGNKVLYG